MKFTRKNSKTTKEKIVGAAKSLRQISEVIVQELIKVSEAKSYENYKLVDVQLDVDNDMVYKDKVRNLPSSLHHLERSTLKVFDIISIRRIKIDFTISASPPLHRQLQSALLIHREPVGRTHSNMRDDNKSNTTQKILFAKSGEFFVQSFSVTYFSQL
ncbi:hypothetical protein LIER_28680 [Lithospermum erythrorhizon]|uniref:Uncharacterized protein n=1 Tax=Lithospermum erythrorhizon TaxID=34254 RepID=A0AAV3RI43_LITER